MTKNSYPILLLALLIFSCSAPKHIQQSTKVDIDSTTTRKSTEIEKINTLLVSNWAKTEFDKSKIEITIKYDTMGRKQEEKINITKDVNVIEKEVAESETEQSSTTSVTDSTKVDKKSEMQLDSKTKRRFSVFAVIGIVLLAGIVFWLLGRFKIPV